MLSSALIFQIIDQGGYKLDCGYSCFSQEAVGKRKRGAVIKKKVKYLSRHVITSDPRKKQNRINYEQA